MTYNKNGLLYVKATKISIEPDAHACSFNELRTVKIEQEGGIVFLDKFDIEKLIKISRNF